MGKAKSGGGGKKKSNQDGGNNNNKNEQTEEEIDAALNIKPSSSVLNPSSHQNAASSSFAASSPILLGRRGAMAAAVAACVAALVWIQWPQLGRQIQSISNFFSQKQAASAIREKAKTLKCKDRHNAKDCSEMAARGDCVQSPGWMYVMCAASCGRCDMLDPKVRCDPSNTGANTKNAMEPGDLNRMFATLAQRWPHKDKIEYLLNGTNPDGSPSKTPWMVLFHDFVTDEEIAALTKHTLPKLQRSTDQGEFDESGYQTQVVSHARTSSNAWCMFACEADPIVDKLTDRIADLVKVDKTNFESYQVLEYKKGQRYDVHHDSNQADRDLPSGPRILTFFMYFSDVEEGGETNFPKLNVKVKPKKGAALLWPSVHSEDPSRVDQRTLHAALPVVKGDKYAANTWIHLRDYKVPNRWGCTGSFT